MPSLISTVSPSTNQVVLRRDGFTIPQLQKVGQAATKAFHNFRSMPFVERRRIVMKALELIQERKGQLGEELTIQMGRPIAYGTKEIETLQKRADYLLKIADDSLKPIAGCPEAGFQRWIEKDPIGPTLIIFAWNVSDASVRYAAAELTQSVSIPDHRELFDSCSSCGQFGHSQAITPDTFGSRASCGNFP